MDLLTGVKQLFSKRATSGPSFHVSQQPPGWVDEFKGWLTTSGITVNEETAINFITVYACMRILAESVASLPLIVYERMPNGGKQRAIDHPLYTLLHDQPNDEMTSFQWREGKQGHLALWGNTYSQIITNGSGDITALWPLLPDRMTVERINGKLVYTYRSNATEGPRTLQADQVLHIPGFGFDGIIGYSPIQVARNAIATGIAADEFGARFFENDARPGGYFTHPGHLGDEAYKRLRDELEERHKGVSKSHKIALLEEGLTFKEIGIPPEDAQFLQTRTFQIREIARMYRIPPHMLADLERATFSNIEQQSIDFVVNSLRPWLVRWEQQILMKLFTPTERKNYFAEFLVDGLLRGDIASRYTAYNTGRLGGWLSVNDIREMENMNPIDEGDEYLVPLNMVPAGDTNANPLVTAGIRSDVIWLGSRKAEATQRAGAAQGAGAGQGVKAAQGAEAALLVDVGEEQRTAQAARRRRRLMTSYKRVFEDTAKRIMRRETNDIRKAGEKFLRKGDKSGFDGWMSGFMAQHEEYVIEVMAPIYLAYSDLVAQLAEEEVDKLKGARMTTVILEDELHDYMANNREYLLERLIEKEKNKPEEPMQVNIYPQVTVPATEVKISERAAAAEPVTVNVYPQITVPVPEVTITNDVQPAEVQLTNEINVQPADLNLTNEIKIPEQKPADFEVKRDSQGRISGIEEKNG